jgi:RHS repeat-associated protein
LQYSYDDLGRLTALSRSGLPSSQWQYDAANQLTQVGHGSNQRGYQYQYDPASRISQWSGNADENRSYSYDNAGRLTAVQSPTSPESYTYDALGNRQNNNAQFDTANRLLEDSSYSYSYDINGNRTEKVNKATGERERYSYNSLNQVIAYQRYADSNAQTPATTDYSYSYGPLGRRWSKQNNLPQATTLFYWSGSSLLGESSSGTTRRYIIEGITPVGFIENGQTYHYLRDHLDTAHEVVNSSGNTVWQGNYSSFGAVDEVQNSVENNLRFPGQYYDSESRLYYNYFRDYDPGLGRYIQSDPIGLRGGLNTYEYVGGIH